MPSSSRPYQSKLLKFVLNQWQRGLERQDQAWRRLQSTATWSTQVAIFPVYAILRAVQRATFALGSATPEQQNPSESISVANDSAAKEHVTDLDHSLTAILSHTQQILSLKQKEQLKIKPKSSILRRAKSVVVALVNQAKHYLPGDLQSTGSSAALTTPQSRAKHLATTHRLQQSGKITTGAATGIDYRSTSGLAQNGTTLASSIQTRRLVLVNSKNEIFDIFTPEQQSDLQHYIARIMQAYQQSRTIVPRRHRQLSVKAILAIGGVFIATLPMEFRKAWSQLAAGPQTPELPHITTSSSLAQPSSQIFYPQTAASATAKTGNHRLPHRAAKSRRLSSNSPDAFEANVNSVSYVEHPLERVLRWLDRILTWCEGQWQKLFEHRSNNRSI